MSDIFDETLKSASAAFFLLPGAEKILYRPRTGAVRLIDAVITRNEAEQLPAVRMGSLPRFEVLVRNDSAKGISSDDFDGGGDKVDLAERIGEPPRTLRAGEIINQDAGMMLIAVQ